MENGIEKKQTEYLSEEKYLRVCKKLKVASIVLCVVGAFCLVGLILSAVLIEVPQMGSNGWFEKSTQRMATMIGCGIAAMLAFVGSLVCFITANNAL